MVFVILFTFDIYIYFYIAGREHRLPGVHGCPLCDVERHPRGKPEVEILAVYTVIQGPLLKVKRSFAYVLSSNHV